jgi:tetratricopeptide (TPR) repeat protein
VPVLALLLWARAGLREGLKPAAAFAAGCVLALAPVTARNWAVSGEPVLVSSHGGLNFYIGNRAEADGTYRRIPGITPDIAGQSRDARSVAETATGRSLTSREVSGYFTARALEWMRAHPGRSAALFLRKLAYLLSDAEIPLNHSYAYYQRDEKTLLRALAVGPWLLVPLGLFGLLDRLRRREGDGFALWASFVPAYALSIAAFFVASRYRLALLVPLAITAGFALVSVGGVVARREWPRVAACALALAPLVVLALWPHRLDDGRSEERTALFEYLVDNNRGAEALERLPALEADHPQKALLLHRLGRAFQDRGEAAQAALLFERALAAGPQRTETRLALGRALLDAGRPAEAISHLRASHDAGVRPDVSGFELARGLAANGQRDEAVRVLGTAPLPADAASLYATGALALELRRADLAREALARSVALSPQVATTREKLGVALYMLGRHEEARRELEEACRLQPQLPSAHQNLAVVYARMGLHAEAVAAVDRALALRPDYPEAVGLRRMLDASAKR